MPGLATAASATALALCLAGEPPVAPTGCISAFTRACRRPMPLPPLVPTPDEEIVGRRPTPEELDRIYDELAEVLRIMARKGFGLHE